MSHWQPRAVPMSVTGLKFSSRSSPSRTRHDSVPAASRKLRLTVALELPMTRTVTGQPRLGVDHVELSGRLPDRWLKARTGTHCDRRAAAGRAPAVLARAPAGTQALALGPTHRPTRIRTVTDTPEERGRPGRGAGNRDRDLKVSESAACSPHE